MFPASSRKVVLVWPNGCEEFVKRSQLQRKLDAVNAKAKQYGRTASGHECHVVMGDGRHRIPTGSKFTFVETVGDARIHQLKHLTPEHETVLTAVLRSVLVSEPARV